MNNIIDDETSRNLIKTKVDENYFVEAGAGSGKTSSLVQRMVTMVKSGIKVEEISAITFTKAAANEFYERFQKELALNQNDPRCKEALENIDLCFMGTIDSFCNMILSEYPSVINVPSNIKNRSKEELIEIYKNEYSKIKAGEYGNELKEESKEFRKFHKNDKGAFVDILMVLMNKRNHELIYKKYNPKELDNLLTNESKKIYDVLNKICQNSSCINNSNKNSTKAYRELSKKIHVLEGKWKNVSNVIDLFKKIKELRLIPDISLSSLGGYACELFNEYVSRGKVSWYEFNKDIYPLDKLNDFRYSISIDFVNKCVDEIAARLKKQGDFEFFDYLLYLKEALKKDANEEGKLIKHIQKRHKYFLLDEFQDTDPIQTEIFFYLTATNLPQADYRKCMPLKGSLFIVGDPKQSIYRFRNADVSAFLKTKELFNNPKIGKTLLLTRNFRSTNKLCEFFNELFSKTLGDDDNVEQSKFIAIPMNDKEEDPEAFGGVYGYTSSFNKDVKEETDAYKVKDIILNIMNDPSLYLPIYEGSKLIGRRPIEYNDFMLITPVKTHLGEYMRVFREYNIPYKVEGNTLFSDSTIFRSLIKIMGALAYPLDPLYIYGALSCDYFKTSKRDLEDLMTSNITLFDNSNCKEFNALKELFNNTKNLSSSSIYEKIIEELKIFNNLDVNNIEYLYYGLELIRKKESTNEIASLIEAYEYLDDINENTDEIERCMSLEKDENKVHLANVHKVKGLEKPIVMLIDPKKKTNAPLDRVEYKDDGSTCHIFKIKKSNSYNYVIETKMFDEEIEKEKKSCEEEEKRLLYVACTRAKNVLIIGSYGIKNQPWSKAYDLVKESILTRYKGNTITLKDKDAVDVNVLYESNKKLDSSNSLSSTYKILKPSKLETNHSKLSNDDIVLSAKDNPMLIGTLVHRLMEILVSSKNNINLKEVCKDIILEYTDVNEEYEKLLFDIGNTMRNGGYKQINGVDQDLLSTLLSSEEVYTEVPFSYMNKDNELINGIIDLIYKKDNNYHIIDYKTNCDGNNLDETYANQLGAYIKAFKEITNQDADAKIYHIAV